jgi:hypothetical protein
MYISYETPSLMLKEEHELQVRICENEGMGETDVNWE